MKRTLLIWTLLCISIALISAHSSWSYEENFDAGKAEDWEDISDGKTWVIEDDTYFQPDKAPVNVFTFYAINDENWKDYTFEVQIKPTGSYAGVLFRVKDAGPGGVSWTDGDFLYWLIGVGGDYSKIWDAPAGAAIDEAPGDTLNSGEWNDVKVVAQGNTFTLYLNGEEQKELVEGDYRKLRAAAYRAYYKNPFGKSIIQNMVTTLTY